MMNSSKWSCSTLWASENAIYYCLSNLDVSSLWSSFVSCRCAFRVNATLSNSWYAFSSGLSVLASNGPGITVWIKFLQFDINSICSLLFLSRCSHLVWLLVAASVARVPKICPNSPSLNFAVLTTIGDPSWLRWIIVGLCSLWCSFFFLSFLFLLNLCWLTCCSASGSASGWFWSGWFPNCWYSLV